MSIAPLSLQMVITSSNHNNDVRSLEPIVSANYKPFECQKHRSTIQDIRPIDHTPRQISHPKPKSEVSGKDGDVAGKQRIGKITTTKANAA